MGNVVSWDLQLKVREGKLDDLRSLMEEMVSATEGNEPGTLIYEWFFSAEHSTCHIYERYQDSAAAMTHLASFGAKFAERIMQLVEPTSLSVYGEPSDELRETLAPWGAVYYV